ncbi:MAG: enoyl-CoA hydratase [Beijerinckiaceae bacterium]|jgi:enoyl-CoA hydratase/carnithine racemase
MTDDLLVSRGDGIVTLTFNRPWARNALTFAMYEGLAGLCAQIDADESVKALVLTGAGGEAFAAGTDISQFHAFASDKDALAYEAMIERVLRSLEGCRVPIIGALAGACTGGGMMIASCCDLRIGAQNLKFGFPIARTLGNCLSAENLARLLALLGEARVKEFVFTARLAGAEEALATGFAGRIVADAPALAAAAHELARDVASNAPLTLLATKRALARQRPRVAPDDDLLLRCYRSRDFREGITAFVEKRKPVWTGR